MAEPQVIVAAALAAELRREPAPPLPTGASFGGGLLHANERPRRPGRCAQGYWVYFRRQSPGPREGAVPDSVEFELDAAGVVVRVWAGASRTPVPL